VRALLFPIVIDQPAHGSGVFLARLVAVHQHMPLNAHPPGKLDQRF